MGDPPRPVEPDPKTPGTNRKPDRWRTVTVPGFGAVPLPPLALYCLAMLAVAAAGIKVDTMWKQVRTEQSAEEVNLFRAHWEDTDKTESTLPLNESGRLVVAYFNHDGAILVTRFSSDARIPPVHHWIVDLARVPLQSSPGPTSGGHLSTGLDGSSERPYPAFPGLTFQAAEMIPLLGNREDGRARKTAIAELTKSPDAGSIQSQQVQACGGRCVNPHPGPFQSWNGQVNGCFIQVWRRWGDSCTHYQWWNSCYNYWDPQIWWTCCVH
jgi:hypothetical protein